MDKPLKSRLRLLSLVLAFICVAGCQQEKKLSSVYSSNIKKLRQCYVMFMEEHSGKGPKSEEQLKTYLKTDATAVFLLKRIDVTPEIVDSIFISERDGQPFVVRYGLKGDDADHAIVLEAEGVEGKRMVALASPIEVESEQYDRYLNGKIKAVTADDFIVDEE